MIFFFLRRNDMTNSGEGYKAEEIKVIAGVGWSFNPTPQQPAGADWWTPKQSVICDGEPVRFTQAVYTVIHALTQTDGHTHTHTNTQSVLRVSKRCVNKTSLNLPYAIEGGERWRSASENHWNTFFFSTRPFPAGEVTTNQLPLFDPLYRRTSCPLSLHPQISSLLFLQACILPPMCSPTLFGTCPTHVSLASLAVSPDHDSIILWCTHSWSYPSCLLPRRIA